MEKLYRYFPLSVSVRSGEIGSLFLSLVIYMVACAIMGILRTILGWIPIVGTLVDILTSLLGLYCVAGMILAVLKFFQYKG